MKIRPTAGAVALALVLIPNPGRAQKLTLMEALDAGLAAHPALVTAGSRVLSADAVVDASEASRLPGVALSAGLTRFNEPMVVAPLHGFDPTRPPDFGRTLVQGQLGASYTVFDGGVRRARVAGAGAMAAAARQGLADVEMEIIEQVTGAYLGVLTARSVLQAADRRRAALEEEANRARRQVDAGAAPELHSLRARAALQEALAGFATAQAQVGLVERSLARLMGVPGTAVSAVELSGVTARAARLGPGAGATNPSILRANRTVDAAEAAVAQERAARLPSLDVGAAVLDFASVGGHHTAEWQTGLRVSWPLFTGGARSAAVRRAEADLDAVRGELGRVELMVSQSIDAAETGLTEAEARAEALEAAVTQWTEVARIEALALDAGSGVQSDLLRAQAGLFEVQAGLARARHDGALARVRLARAQGILDRDWMNEALETRR